MCAELTLAPVILLSSASSPCDIWVLPLGVGAIKSLQECQRVDVKHSRCQRWSLLRKGITILVLVQIAAFWKGRRQHRVVAEPEGCLQTVCGMFQHGNSGHYSITIYPVLTLYRTLSKVQSWNQYYNHLVFIMAAVYMKIYKFVFITIKDSLYNMHII